MVQRNTLFRAAYELLYTPLEDQQKRATKALIDVGFDRFGTVLGSGLVMATVAIFTHNQSILIGAVVVLAVATLPLARQLHRGYVAALEERLRAGERTRAEEPDAAKPPSVGFDEKAHDALIEKVEQVREHHEEPGPAAHAPANQHQLTDAASALLSKDAQRKRRALAGWDRSKLTYESSTMTQRSQSRVLRAPAAGGPG